MIERIGRTLGFTLMEMAIVLVVIGLLLSGGLMAVSPIVQGTKVADTQQRLDRIEEALILYVIRNGCLPCPADGSVAGLDGSAVGENTTYTSQCLADAAASTTCGAAVIDPNGGDAVVPWAALGLSQTDTTDGWGNLIKYVVDGPSVALNSTSMVRTPPAGYPAGVLEVRDATPGGPALITEVAAYVLISHGTDMRGARAPGGAAKLAPDAGNTVQLNNAAGLCTDATPCHQDSPYDITGADHFDDIVRWRTAPMIIQLCGNNACGNPA
jgi:prepilin-type N-terminal cleavage/methylation domain-containing protein